MRVELDESGNRRGSASVVLDMGARTGDVADLAAAWVGERMAVAWIERADGKARARATWAAPNAPVFELGPAFLGPATARGNIVVAARRQMALVFSRGVEAPCIDPGKNACYSFDFHELSADRATKTGVPLSVPVPCIDNSTALAVLSSRYHYGVCTDDGKGPVTTVFTITPEPAYARAEQVLAGCEPAGTFVWKNNAWLVAECQGNRRAARIGGGDEVVEYLDMRAPTLECRAGIATIRASTFELALDEPRPRLEALLPTSIAPRGSRALFTGHAVLVASSAGTALRLARYTCTGERLDESNVPLD
jgi:hypothetical protein